MLHADYKEYFRKKKIGILGQGNIGYNLSKTLGDKEESLDAEVFIFNRNNLREILKYEFDYFFDCAGPTGDFRSKILKTAEANVSIPIFLLRNLKVKESVTVMSSSRIYGFHDTKELLIDEEFNHATPHLSLDYIFDGSKQLMESIFINYQKQVPYRISLIRLSNVYGKFKPPQIDESTYLKVMIRHYLEHSPIKVRLNPQSSKDYIFIDDAVDGILRAAALSDKTDYFNIASGKSSTIQEWIEFLKLNASYNTSYPIPQHCTLSIAKAGRLLGFSPNPALHGLDKMIVA